MMQRKLTVILAADIAGYSGLMERDETGTLTRLQESRKFLFDPRVAAHGGRIFKLMGDGVLVEFPKAAESESGPAVGRSLTQTTSLSGENR